jgi:hypothetical protein
MDELPKLQKILHEPEPLWMKRKREGQKTMTAGQSFYAPHKRRNRPGEVFPEGKYPYYCSLVLEAALELNPSIRALYIEIVRSITRPGIQEYRQELMFLQPSKMIAAFNALDERFTQHPDLIDGDVETLNNAANNFFQKYVNNPDFIYHRECVKKFILTGFNSEEWLKPRITGETSKFLAWAVATRSAMDSENVTFAQLDQRRMQDRYWVMQTHTDDIMNRPDKRIRANMKGIASDWRYSINHEDPLYLCARLWYVGKIIKNSLVIACQIGEYNGFKLPVYAYPRTAQNKIKDFDLAMFPKVSPDNTKKDV